MTFKYIGKETETYKEFGTSDATESSKLYLINLLKLNQLSGLARVDGSSFDSTRIINTYPKIHRRMY